MNIKKLKTGSLSLLFNLEGTDYSINLLSEEGSGEDKDDSVSDEKQEDIVEKTVKKYKVELKAANRSVMLEKVVDGENAPEYKVNGEGMEKEEMVTFGQNWVAMVFGSLDSFGVVQGNLDMRTMGLEPFFHMFNHFFGERLEELMAEMEEEEMEEEGMEEEAQTEGV